jgi:hypothetical protein
MKTTIHANSRLFKAISWLFVGMTGLFLVTEASVATVDLVVQRLFQHNPSR